ncbi:MAG: VTT domain-containing protein, partial [Rhodospirillales bacterium]|nr:VTT domain-containing protein [Rhodospirillales bacterium]
AAAFLAGGLLMLPIFPLIVLAAALFGLWAGLGYALLGCLASGCFLFILGRALGRDAVRLIAGRRTNRISRALARHGIIAVIILRLVPVTSFTVTNLMLGASRIPFGSYVLGTVIGMAPPALGLALFGDRLAAVLYHPDWLNTGMLAAVAMGLVTAGLSLARRVTRGAAPAPSPRSEV